RAVRHHAQGKEKTSVFLVYSFEKMRFVSQLVEAIAQPFLVTREDGDREDGSWWWYKSDSIKGVVSKVYMESYSPSNAGDKSVKSFGFVNLVIRRGKAMEWKESEHLEI
ncbi:hypothetical protein AAMO2058_001302800, partial [Amorphochlora amoebiformis]